MNLVEPGHVIEIFLQPGEWYFGDEGTRIRTLLGSCVAITLWHPLRRLGGMCHYMLPERRNLHCGIADLDGRYANEAVMLLLREVARMQTKPFEYEVKLFGGGDMFPQIDKHARAWSLDVPCQNIEAGHRLTQYHGFRVKTEHVGGIGQCHVIFDVCTGHVWVRRDKALKAGTGDSAS